MRFSSSFCLAVLVLLCSATPSMRAQSTGYWRYVRTETYVLPYSGAYPDTSVTGGEGALTVVMQEPSVTPVPTLGSTFTWTPPPAILVPGTKIDWPVTAKVTRNVQGRNLGQSLDSGLYPYQTASNLAKFNPYSTLRPGAVATDATMPVGKLVTYNNALLPNPSKIPSGSSYMDPQGLMTWLVRVNSSQTYYWSYIYQWVQGAPPTGSTATSSNTTATGATNLVPGKPAEAYWRYVRTETYVLPYSGAYPDTSVTGGEGALTVVMQEPSVTPVPTLGSTFTWTPPPAILVPGTKIDWPVTAKVTRNVQGRNLGQSLDSGLYPYQTASNLAKFNPYSTLRPGAVATDATMPVGKLVTYNNVLQPNPSKIPSGSSYMDPQGLMTWLVRVNSSQTYYWSYIYQWVQGESPTGNTATSSNTTATGATNLALGKPAEMSSVYSAGYEASQCNNGSKDDMCHSKSEANPWWQVDLQGSYSLGDIVVYNRPGTYGSRENTITALISSDGRNWQRIYSHDGSDFAVLHIPVNGLTARYVRVQLNATDYMNLTEVEVYSIQGRAKKLPR